MPTIMTISRNLPDVCRHSPRVHDTGQGRFDAHWRVLLFHVEDLLGDDPNHGDQQHCNQGEVDPRHSCADTITAPPTRAALIIEIIPLLYAVNESMTVYHVGQY